MRQNVHIQTIRRSRFAVPRAVPRSIRWPVMRRSLQLGFEFLHHRPPVIVHCHNSFSIENPMTTDQKLALTAATVMKLKPAPGQRDAMFFDLGAGGIRQLALRVRASGARTWIFQYRLDTSRNAAPSRLKIGAPPAMMLEAARKAAQALVVRMAATGADPVAERREAKRKSKSTLAVALDSYDRDLKERAYVNRATVLAVLRGGFSGRRLATWPL